MQDTLIIRRAQLSDAPAIALLIGALMPCMTLRPDGAGAEAFIESMACPAIETYISGAAYHYQVGLIGGELAGVVALRDNSHLFHLFVAQKHHRQGIARRLWEAALRAAMASGNAEGFTVNSSLHGLPLYQSLGFVATGAKVEQHGIAYVPMVLTLGYKHVPNQYISSEYVTNPQLTNKHITN